MLSHSAQRIPGFLFYRRAAGFASSLVIGPNNSSETAPFFSFYWLLKCRIERTLQSFDLVYFSSSQKQKSKGSLGFSKGIQEPQVKLKIQRTDYCLGILLFRAALGPLRTSEKPEDAYVNSLVVGEKSDVIHAI